MENYKLIGEKPENTTEIYTEEDIEVIYYYRKQEFNLSVEKQIERITVKVIENIPDFFRTAEGTSIEWTENGKTLEANVELKPGETKELEVVLRWIRNSNNFGLQVNTVTLQNITNPANYEEKDLTDNTATVEVIFSVKTGGIDASIIIGTTLVVMLGALIITIYLKEKKKK